MPVTQGPLTVELTLLELGSDLFGVLSNTTFQKVGEFVEKIFTQNTQYFILISPAISKVSQSGMTRTFVCPGKRPKNGLNFLAFNLSKRSTMACTTKKASKIF